MERLYHLTRTEQLTPGVIKNLFQLTERYERFLKVGAKKLTDLEGVRIHIVFFEESTRTYSTFYAASETLGASVFGLPEAGKFSAFAKEESLEHGIEFWSGAGIPYLRCADIIIIRHPEPDAAERAARVSKVPIINAGCGGEEGHHPTQVLLDLYTFKKFLGKLENFNIAFVGDLRFSRIVPPEVILLSQYPGIKFYFVAPEGFKLPENIKALLRNRGISFEESDNLKEVIPDCHIGYITRIQKNRLEKLGNKKEAKELLKIYQKTKGNFVLTPEVYQISERLQTIFCHPGPISAKEKEIQPEVEGFPRVRFLEHWSYGLPTKMALLSTVWQSQREKDNFEKILPTRE